MFMTAARLIKILSLFACGFVAAGWLSPDPGSAAETPSYVGNAACARCHQSIARAYAETPMARSSGEARAEFDEAEFTHPPSGIRYRITGEGGKVFLEYERVGAAAIKGRQQLHYFIGSNAAGRSYLFSLDRFLFQSPVTYYSQSKRWGVSPGYEADREMRLNRPVDANCLFCHASQSQPIYGAQNRFADQPFKHEGVSCERCHGPGSLHVEGKAKLVNPAKLDPARRDSICAQCHLSGESRVELPNQRLAQFRPGDLLADYVSFFVFENAAGRALKVNSHVENLAGSACRLKSGDRMSCMSCHDPHSVPRPQEKAAWYRNRCLQCHQAGGLSGVHNSASAPDLDCAGCHMPKARAVDGGHGVMTDHGIPLRGPLIGPFLGTRPETEAGPAGGLHKMDPAGGARKLVPFPGFRSDDRMLGLAYAEVALVSGAQFHESEAFRLLTAALNALAPNGAVRAGDAEFFARLGFLHQQRGALPQAARAYEIALQTEPSRTDALVNLGGIYAAQGRIEEADKLWREALRRNAGLTEAAVNLARAYRSEGKLSQARELLQRAIRFDPDSGQVRQLLKDIESDSDKLRR